MKISLQWLHNWIEHDFDANNLAAQLTMAGLEVGGIVSLAPSFSGVVVGEVLEVAQHPDAERLHICKVRVGSGEPLLIVCGAANVRAGLKVPVAVIGAILPDNFKIKKAKLRGVESHGMICSAKELQLAEESQGIMELPEEVPVGIDFGEYLKLNDYVLEVDITPNRGDCLSMMGMAREICVINNLPLQTPFVIESQPEAVVSGHEKFPCDVAVEIMAQDACPHYVGRVVKGVNIKAQIPLWMKERLRRMGLQSINPIVDVTNYVMLELGQPLHAFNLAKISGKVVVRYAQAGEKLVALGGEELKLKASDLVIADQSKVLALAGIIGGFESAVNETTTDVFLESACFVPEKIGVCARSFGLQTDAAYRFERGVDPNLQVLALKRVTQLLLEIVGGKASEIVEIKNEVYYPKRANIEFKHKDLGKLLGFEIGAQEVERILLSLGIDLRKNDQGWNCSVPSYRFDINIAEDLVEEVARIYGYDRIPERAIIASLDNVKKDQQNLVGRLQKQVSELMAAKGYSEVITYSFVDPKIQNLLDPHHVALSLAKPISPEMSVMRTSLWTGLFGALKYYNQDRAHRDLKHFDAKLFEIGVCFLPDSKNVKNLRQDTMLAGIAIGQANCGSLLSAEKSREIDFFDIKGDLQHVLGSVGYNSDQLVFEATTNYPALHPKQSATIKINGVEVGLIGQMHPNIRQELDLALPTYLFEVNLSLLSMPSKLKFREISKFPAIERDLAFLIDSDIVWQQIEEKIKQAGGELLQTVQVFDVYHNDEMGAAKKSIAVRLCFQHLARTLLGEEVDEAVSKIVSVLEHDLLVTLRAYSESLSMLGENR